MGRTMDMICWHCFSKRLGAKPQERFGGNTAVQIVFAHFNIFPTLDYCSTL